MCIRRRPRRYVLSTICSEEDWMVTNKETIRSAMLSQCGEDTSVQEKEKNLHWVFISEDERMTVVRTLLLVRIRNNGGLSIVKKNHQCQHGDCTNMFTTSAGRTKETIIRQKKGQLQELLLRTGISHEEIGLKVDAGRICACDEQERLHS